MEKKIILQSHLTKTFFVINKEEVNDWLYAARINVLALVKQGFSRDEIYFMPYGELQDYIKILNQKESQIEKETSDIDTSINDIKMAGNTF